MTNRQEAGKGLHLSESDGSQKAWRAAGDGHGEEGGVHGADVGCPTGKQVVGVEVEQHDDGEGVLPREAIAGHHVHHLHHPLEDSCMYSLITCFLTVLSPCVVQQQSDGIHPCVSLHPNISSTRLGQS